MKKIALVVAAILVIGIQGCSTDDLSNLENNKQENEVNTDLNKRFPSCLQKLYVVFPEDADEIYRSEYMQWARVNVFSFILHSTEPVCDNVYMWVVPCDELNFYKNDSNGEIVLKGKKDEGTGGDDVGCPRCTTLELGFIENENPDCIEFESFR